MSTFNDVDIFGSGRHTILVGREMIAKKRTAFAGVDGVDSIILGGRGWPVMISGQLRAANRLALEVLISAIEDACKDGSASLVTTDGDPVVTYTNVELDNIQLVSRIMFTSSEVIVKYVVTGLRLYS